MKISLFDGFFAFNFDWKAVTAIAAALVLINVLS
ncbi:hypothetical protein K413DRAFT_4628 [Clostridium sp. ASBs410]|nr:hypothetical protein K413DRAFT_4628 [Clostridium sp. ASBs410]